MRTMGFVRDALHWLAGVVAQLATTALLFPLDVVKIRMQAAPLGSSDGSRGVVWWVQRIVAEEGPNGFYRGLGGYVRMEAVHGSAFWLFHGLLFRYLTPDRADTEALGGFRRLLLNMLARQFMWLVTAPFELVANLNLMDKECPGLLRTAARVAREEGVFALYKGLGLTLLLSLNPAIMQTLMAQGLKVFAFLERRGIALRRRLSRGRRVDDGSPSPGKKKTQGGEAEKKKEDAVLDASAKSVFAATVVAKIVATLLTYPLIRAKIVQQTTRGSGGVRDIPFVLRQIVTQEGWRGLYSGVLAMSYKTVIWNSLMMAMRQRLVRQKTRRMTAAAAADPGTPQQRRPPPSPTQARLPGAFREPFPLEFLALEKLDRILEWVETSMDQQSSVPAQIARLEASTLHSYAEIRECLCEMQRELRELRREMRPLLLTKGKTATSTQPPQGPATQGGAAPEGARVGFGELETWTRGAPEQPTT